MPIEQFESTCSAISIGSAFGNNDIINVLCFTYNYKNAIHDSFSLDYKFYTL
jgi:hypothetical protein